MSQLHLLLTDCVLVDGRLQILIFESISWFISVKNKFNVHAYRDNTKTQTYYMYNVILKEKTQRFVPSQHVYIYVHDFRWLLFKSPFIANNTTQTVQFVEDLFKSVIKENKTLLNML